MTPLIIAVTFVILVLIAGLTAGPLIRGAAPALMRMPRVAVAALIGVLAVWLVGLAAFGPMLAWVLAAPTGFLPGNTGEICQRCLSAANPLPADRSFEAGIPAGVLLALPVVLLGAMLIGGVRHRRQQQRQHKQLESALRLGARTTRLAGHVVTVIPHTEPTAFALSDRRWGIVVSTELMRLLNADEMAAVIAHEAAHVRQRHHLIIGLLHGILAPFRWIPLVASINAAIPHYLEMAADNAARQRSGTDAVASALLKIGEKGGPAAEQRVGGAVALHAAGIDRIRHLIAPPDASQGVWATAAIAVTTATLLVTSGFMLLPYWQAILAGCLI
jgi:Zn-dependent protease with chaperone function